MKSSQIFKAILMLVITTLACNVSTPSGLSAEETRVAVAVLQTGLAIQQATLNAPTVPPPAATYTPYPTYTAALISATSEAPQGRPPPRLSGPARQEETCFASN